MMRKKDEYAVGAKRAVGAIDLTPVGSMIGQPWKALDYIPNCDGLRNFGIAQRVRHR
jgi:hypothetical protein